MKFTTTLIASMLVAAPLAAQQHVVPEASDIHDNTASTYTPPTSGGGPDMAMWAPAGTTFYNRSRPGGEWTGSGTSAEFHIFGGELFASQWGVTRTNVVESWSVASQSWSTNAATMPIPVSNISGACEVNNGVIYVFGGYDGTNTAIANVQAFDGTNFVDTGAALSEAAWGVGAMNDTNGDIIAFGGFGIGTGTAKVACDVFTPPASISAGVPMPANLYLTTGAYNNQSRTSHAVGGFGQEQTHYIWDGVAWSNGAAPANPRGACGMAAGKKVVACIAGGYSTYRTDQEIYNTTSGAWSNFSGIGSMTQGRRTYAHGITFSGAFPNKYNYMAANGWAGASPVAPLNDGEQIL